MSAKRIQVIDDIKTALVIVMLMYHSASILNASFFSDLCNYLSFVHLSFVFVTGLLIGLHYNILPVTHAIRMRLFVRGMKILLVFFSCNLLLYMIDFLHFPKLISYYKECNSVLFWLQIPGKYCAFEILYYIGFFLFVSVGFLLPVPWYAAMLLGCIATVWNRFPFFSTIGWGLLGMGLGTLCNMVSVQIFLHRIKKFSWCSIPLLIIVLFFFHRPNGIVLFIECLLWFLSFILLFKIGNLGKKIVLFGKYTLFAYLVQMLLITILVKISSIISIALWGKYCMILCVSSLMCYGIIALLDILRRNFSKVNKIYRIIFN